MSKENNYFDLKLSKTNLDIHRLVVLAELLTLPLGVEKVVVAGEKQKMTVTHSHKLPKLSEQQLQAFSDKLPDSFSLQITLSPGFFYLIENNRFYLTHEIVSAVEARMDLESGAEKKHLPTEAPPITWIEIFTYPGLDRACNYLLSLIQILK